MTDLTGLPDFSMARAAGCPFDPAPELSKHQRERPMRRIRLWDGSTPWLVTSYTEQRALLGDPQSQRGPENSRVPQLRRGFRQEGAELRHDGRPRAQPAAAHGDLTVHREAGGGHASSRGASAILHQESTPSSGPGQAGRCFEYLSTLVEGRFDSPGDDMLSGLTGRIRSGELTKAEATEIGVLMLLAGHETTANMIGLGTLALLEHPDQLALPRENLDDPKLVASAVEELLRYLTITHGGRRRSRTSRQPARPSAPAREMILVNETGNRDPAVFPDPDRLDLRRDARSHLSFGFGVHQCLGQPLAGLELQIVYRTLFQRVPNLQLATELDRIPFRHDGFVHGVYELPVTW